MAIPTIGKYVSKKKYILVSKNNRRNTGLIPWKHSLLCKELLITK